MKLSSSTLDLSVLFVTLTRRVPSLLMMINSLLRHNYGLFHFKHVGVIPLLIKPNINASSASNYFKCVTYYELKQKIKITNQMHANRPTHSSQLRSSNSSYQECSMISAG